MIDLSKVKDFKALFVGDSIVDVYRYVRPRGKAIKSHSLSVEYLREESFMGGVWAAAQHAKGFCASVDVMFGEKRMCNVYYVEDTYNQKLFNTHSLYREELVPIHARIGDYDVVVVTDFGHGTMTKELIERVSREARYLAINAQTNTMNYGFNLVTKYPRADLVVIDELEARLAARDRDGDIEEVILALGFRNIIVTRGKNGAIGFDGAFERRAAATEKIVDTIGAGDAFLAVCAPYAAAGASMKDLIRIGNAAGAIKCGVIGHRSSVDRDTLGRYLNG
jgi:hypothetical protein